MMQKYCSNGSPLAPTPMSRGSPTWKRLTKAWGHAHPHIRWLVGTGRICFWDDIWLGDIPLRETCIDERGNPMTTVSEFFTNGTWDVPKLQLPHDQAGLPQPIIDRIRNTPIITEDPDVPRWTLSRRGNFTLAVTREVSRSQGPIIQGLEDIWKAGLTTSMAIFNWRLLSNRIPVDSKLQWRKIEIASKCNCCPHRPSTESLQHLFIQGVGVRRVWKEFDGWFEGPSSPLGINDTIPTRIEVWARRTQQPGRKHLSRALPYIIFWFLWAERNRSRHHELQFRANNVVWQTITFIRNNMENGRLKPKHWRGVRLGVTIPSRAECLRPLPLAMMIKWEPPDQPWIKLNTDGSYFERSGKAGGGGIIQNHSGTLILAYALTLEAQSPLEAELLAIQHGLKMAEALAKPIWLESDAEQAINLIKGAQWGPAHTRHAMAHIALLKRRLTLRTTFIHREGNKAADLLAKMGTDMICSQTWSEQDVPWALTDIVRLEQKGTPNICVREDGET
ncbi:uncharacterized protein LOC121781444 [Salvia splendens]|uniref:uncharacterized protein LOC121781444 n=1 Tax=Salvia splendens TaxID=180675 RepID=UPI001C27D420|nr:uncharacterized protein LOC121781444 [Salvia splendens]